MRRQRMRTAARAAHAPPRPSLRSNAPARSYSNFSDDPFFAPPSGQFGRRAERGFKFSESVENFWRAVEQDKWVVAATHFDKIRRHSIPPADAYNKMLEHTARWLPIESSLQMFNDMQASGVQPDLNTYKHIMIGALGTRRELTSVLQLVQEMKERGLEPSDGVMNELIVSYVKSQRIDLALETYDKLVADKRPVEPRVYADLVELLAQKGIIERALEVFNQCRAGDPATVPNRLYPIMLSLYIRRNKGAQALQLFGEMRQRFQPSETQTHDVLRLLARSGMVKEALEVFEAMRSSRLPRPDVASYGEIIYMFCRAGEPEKAVRTLEEMKMNNLAPRPGDFEVILDTLLRDGIVQPAFDLVQEMHRCGIKPNATRFSMLLKMLAKEGDLHKCNVMDAMAKQTGLQYDKGTYTALIGCAAQKRDVNVCIQFLNACGAVHGQSANWYNAAFMEFVHQGKQEIALQLLGEMQRAGVEPNEVTYRLFLTLGDMAASRGKLPHQGSKQERDSHWWIPPLPSPFSSTQASSSATTSPATPPSSASASSSTSPSLTSPPPSSSPATTV